MIRRVVGIHFSPVGGTAGMTEMLTDQLADILGEFCPGPVEKQTYELLKSDGKDIILDDETATVIGMPVYVGKVPVPALNALSRVKANGSVAVAAVSFGARSYGNALYELQHHAENQGFRIVGAGAFSVRYTRHGLSPSGKTYSGDIKSVNEFGSAAAAKIRRLAGSEIEGLRIKPAPLEVSGRLPIHRISRISPRAAAAAQSFLERVAVRRRGSEWFL